MKNPHRIINCKKKGTKQNTQYDLILCNNTNYNNTKKLKSVISKYWTHSNFHLLFFYSKFIYTAHALIYRLGVK